MNCERCGNEILGQGKKYCGKECARQARFGRKYSLETRQKIAQSNTGKVFSEERCQAISKAKTFVPSEEFLKKINEFWSMGLNPSVIANEMDISLTLYHRLKKKYCKIELVNFMPIDLYPDEFKKIKEMGQQNLYYIEIARSVNRGKKRVFDILKKMGFTPNTRNPVRRINFSKLEMRVGDALRSFGIELTEQFPLGRFFFDFHVKGTNKLIEVHGDYWHCNPDVFTGPRNEFQVKALRRDFCKKQVAKDLGYTRYVVWEKDLKNDFEVTLRKLRESICKS